MEFEKIREDIMLNTSDLERAVDGMVAGAKALIGLVNNITVEMQMYGIKEALTEYHNALDTRQHGGVAQDKFTHAVEKILNMHWVRGATLKDTEK